MRKSIEITVNQPLEHVTISNKRRAAYYKKGDKIPKKYMYLKFDKKGYLKTKDGEKVVKNPISAGTPKKWKINGQGLYSGIVNRFTRKKMKDQLYESYVKKWDIEKGFFIPMDMYPLKIEWEFHHIIGKADWDLDNKWVYLKVFLDTLSAEGVIFDDSIKYITNSPSPTFFPVETKEESKFVFRFTRDNRPEIINHPFYKNITNGSNNGFF
jgi:hypothetical protein